MWKRDETLNSPVETVPASPTAGEGRRPSDKMVMDLGKSVIIKGELSASEDLTIYGQMEGSIRVAGHTLTIGPHADIRAGIDAGSVVIMGAVTGNVTAAEKIEIQRTGSVFGDVKAPRLAIADGGCLSGKVQMPDRQSRRSSA